MSSFIPVFVILILLSVALIPAFTAYRLHDNALLIFALISGFLFFLVIPWIICIIFVNRKISKEAESPIHFAAFSVFWPLLFILFLILPLTKDWLLGLTANGYQILFVGSIIDNDAAKYIIYFIIINIIAFISSFFFRKRAILSGNQILLFFSCLFYSVFSFILGTLHIAAGGIYILGLFYIVAIAALYYTAYYLTKSREPINPVSNVPVSSTNTMVSKNIKENIKASVPGIKDTITNNLNSINNTLKQSAQKDQKNQVQVHCTNGDYATNTFTLSEGNALYMGTSPQKANLIFNSNEISRLHCTIICTEKSGTVRVIDSSTNGTYLSNGTRLPSKLPVDIQLPCTLFFGNAPQMFEITK